MVEIPIKRASMLLDHIKNRILTIYQINATKQLAGASTWALIVMFSEINSFLAGNHPDGYSN